MGILMKDHIRHHIQTLVFRKYRSPGDVFASVQALLSYKATVLLV